MSEINNIKIHNLKPSPGSKKSKMRVGRGEASKGKTAGRGTKGTKARYQVKVGFEGGQTPIQMRLPKLKGFKNSSRISFQVINLEKLVKLFPKGGKIGVDDIVKTGAVRRNALIKILGVGSLDVNFEIEADAFSKNAIQKIENAGGKAIELE